MEVEKGKGTDVSDVQGEDDLDEEPGEEIESAPPLKVGEERELGNSGIKKKLLNNGIHWETPEFGDEVTVHFVGTLLNGIKFCSTRDNGEPITFELGEGKVAKGLDNGITTMKKGERVLFTLPLDFGYGAEGRDGVPPDSIVQFEVELLSWITVVDICKDGGIIKKIMEKGERNERPSDLDEVLVKYQVTLAGGTIVAKTPEEGYEFYVKDGHLFPALTKAIITMKRGEKVKLIVQPKYAFGDKGKEATDGFPSIPPNSVLNVELELVSFKPVIDVTGDSKVFKKILKEGEGALVANEGAAVTISYIAWLEDGTVFERKGVDGGQPLEFITDEEQVIPGLDRAAATMKKGEQALLTICPEYGFGSVVAERDLAVVPPSSNLVYEVEMLDFVKEKAPWELNNQEKIEAAGKKKEEGNILFKDGNYQRAGKKYDKAVDYVSEDGLFQDDEQKQIKALRISCWLNGAACSLKLSDFWGAIQLCSKVLDFESYNVKALYRRAQAYMKTSDLISAEMDIKKVLEADPQNREVKLLQKTLRQLQVESNKRDAKLFTNMFAQMSKGSSMPVKKLKVEIAEPEKSEEAAATERECVAEPSTPSEDRMAVDQSREIPFVTCYPSNKKLKRSNVQKPALLPQPCSPVSFSRKERRKLV